MSEPSQTARILEALLFLSSEPLSVADLAEALELEPAAVQEALSELAQQYAPGQRGIQLRELGGGFTLATDPIAEPAARRLLGRPAAFKLTPTQSETLAIVAYLQPISRPEIARIRGVNADSAVAALLERSLIEEVGRSRFGAVQYGTGTNFLKRFGLKELADLPDISTWDPRPEEEGSLRERLLRAGEARAGSGASPA